MATEARQTVPAAAIEALAPDLPEEAVAPAAGPPVIEARAVGKSFGENVVLRDLSLEVRAGEIFGLIGPSGSGKSTTIHLLCGHLRPSHGEVRVLGHAPDQFSGKIRRRIGYMPQGFVLYPDLTVEQNVAFAAGLYGLAEWRSRPRIRATLELVQLWEARKRPARAVSGGMQRRIALAAALVHDPELLFVDEPTANLDPILRARLWEHFRALRGRGRALLVTTQYVDEAEQCDRVGLMYGGALIAVGRPLSLRRQAFGGDIVEISVARSSPGYVASLAGLPGVRATEERGDEPLRVTVDDANRAIPVLLDALERGGATIRAVAPYQPTFDEVFIRLIQQHGERRPPVGRLRTTEA